MALDEEYSWQEIYERVCKRIPTKSKAQGFKKWFFSNEKNGYLFDPLLIGRSYTAYHDMNSIDRDHFGLVFGLEGSGKSTLGCQWASWIDPNFSEENICFTPEDYITRLKTIQKGGCLVLDEGGTVLFSRESMSMNNIMMTKLFMLQRQKNISVVVCCPSYWDVDTYLRRHRINTLIRVIKQGKYQAYLPRAINIINDIGYRKKKISSMRLPSGSFWHGDFRKVFPKCIDRDVYLQRKKEHLDKFINSIDIDFQTIKMIPAHKVARELTLSPKQMRKRILKGTIKAKKIGAKWFISKEEYDNLLRI